jgi:hypothetical protein
MVGTRRKVSRGSGGNGRGARLEARQTDVAATASRSERFDRRVARPRAPGRPRAWACFALPPRPRPSARRIPSVRASDRGAGPGARGRGGPGWFDRREVLRHSELAAGGKHRQTDRGRRGGAARDRPRPAPPHGDRGAGDAGHARGRVVVDEGARHCLKRRADPALAQGVSIGGLPGRERARKWLTSSVINRSTPALRAAAR